jgi:predicted enzyme related to lactoylglutathione lyase
MNSIHAITLEVADLESARTFYDRAFDLGDLVRFRISDAPATGFRGYTLSLVVSQPGNVVALFDSAVAAGATTLKPAAKSLWGFGGVVQAPDGAIWNLATSSKKDTAPANRKVDEVVLLLGVDDVRASKRFYVDHGLTVGKSVGSYVDFAMPSSPIFLARSYRSAS